MNAKDVSLAILSLCKVIEPAVKGKVKARECLGALRKYANGKLSKRKLWDYRLAAYRSYGKGLDLGVHVVEFCAYAVCRDLLKNELWYLLKVTGEALRINQEKVLTKFSKCL